MSSSSSISQNRKLLFLVGTIMVVVGVLAFLSTFVTFAMNFGNFSGFEQNMRSDALRAFGGMILIFLGAFVRRAGALGMAGSGVVLDPERARKDLRPYSELAGGVVKDALEAAELRPGTTQPGAGPAQVVKLRCRACGKLNEDDSKFCQECGQPI